MTRKDKLKVVAARLENTALYMAAGFWVGVLNLPSPFFALLVALMVVFAGLELAFPKLTFFKIFKGDEDDLFIELTRILAESFLFFFVGYVLARVL